MYSVNKIENTYAWIKDTAVSKVNKIIWIINIIIVFL